MASPRLASNWDFCALQAPVLVWGLPYGGGCQRWISLTARKPLCQQAAPHWEPETIRQTTPYSSSNFAEFYPFSTPYCPITFSMSCLKTIVSSAYKQGEKVLYFKVKTIIIKKLFVLHWRIPLHLSLLFINHQSGINYYKSLKPKRRF